MTLTPETIDALERHFDEMIEMQRAKVARVAQTQLPHLTAEDLLNPQDFPELEVCAHFNFEDGILAGLLQSQMSLRAGFYFTDEEPPTSV